MWPGCGQNVTQLKINENTPIMTRVPTFGAENQEERRKTRTPVVQSELKMLLIGKCLVY